MTNPINITNIKELIVKATRNDQNLSIKELIIKATQKDQNLSTHDDFTFNITDIVTPTFKINHWFITEIIPDCKFERMDYFFGDPDRHQDTSFHDDPDRHQDTSFRDDSDRHQDTSFHKVKTWYSNCMLKDEKYTFTDPMFITKNSKIVITCEQSDVPNHIYLKIKHDSDRHLNTSFHDDSDRHLNTSFHDEVNLPLTPSFVTSHEILFSAGVFMKPYNHIKFPCSTDHTHLIIWSSQSLIGNLTLILESCRIIDDVPFEIIKQSNNLFVFELSKINKNGNTLTINYPECKIIMDELNEPAIIYGHRIILWK